MFADEIKRIEADTHKRKATIVCVAALCVLLLGIGCMVYFLGNMKVVFTTGLKEGEIFKTGSLACTRTELMVYLTNMQNQYEAVYGSEIWNAKGSSPSLEHEAKEQVLTELAQVKCMVLLAKEKGVSLDKKEEERAAAAGKEYFGSLNETEVSALGLDEKMVSEMYREYALAEKVYHKIVEDVNPEISDDEARTITVLQIRLDSAKKAQEVLARVQEESADFESLAETYSLDPVVRYSFGKGEVDREIEAAAFDLGKDEVSDILSVGDNWYILKCTSTFDEAQTQVNKVRILAQRRNEAFHTEYNDFVDALPRQLDEEQWDAISFIRDENVKTDSFFSVYNTYFHVTQE